jgi:hypothetical protein
VQDFWIRRSLVRRNDRPISRALREFQGLLGKQVNQLRQKMPGVKVHVK